MGAAQGLGSCRAVAMGVTGSGKTDFLLKHFLRRERRLLIVDRTGEWRKLYPGAPRVVGYARTVAALRTAAPAPEWAIVTVLSNEELAELTRTVLLTEPEPERGFSASVGGMALAVDEVDLILPNSYANPVLAGLWRLGRHARLSVYSATQKPSRVSKECTAMSEWVAILRLHEVRCLKYVRDLIGQDCFAWGEPWFRREQYGCLLYHTPSGLAYRIDRSGRRVGTWNPADAGEPEPGKTPLLKVVR